MPEIFFQVSLKAILRTHSPPLTTPTWFFSPHSSCKPDTLCCISCGKLTTPSNFWLLSPGFLSVFDSRVSITGGLGGAYPSCPHHCPCNSPQQWAVSFPSNWPSSSLSSQSFFLPHCCSFLNCLTLSQLGVLISQMYPVRKPKCLCICEIWFAWVGTMGMPEILCFLGNSFKLVWQIKLFPMNQPTCPLQHQSDGWE